MRGTLDEYQSALTYVVCGIMSSTMDAFREYLMRCMT